VVILNIILGPVSKFTVTALVDGAPYQCTVSIQLSRDALLCGGGGEAGGQGRGVANTTEGIGWEAQEPNILRDWGTCPVGERQAKVPSRCRHARAGKGEKDGEGRRTGKAEKPETKCTCCKSDGRRRGRGVEKLQNCICVNWKSEYARRHGSAPSSEIIGKLHFVELSHGRHNWCMVETSDQLVVGIFSLYLPFSYPRDFPLWYTVINYQHFSQLVTIHPTLLSN
jgi:hypothetical protein